MAKTAIEQIVERVVTQVLEDHIPQLRSELVNRVLSELGPQLKPAVEGPSSGSNTADLVKAIGAIQAGSSQKEILRALLDGTSSYCGRAALFVIKGGAAAGWQGRGFKESDSIKDFVLDVSGGTAGQALQSRTALTGSGKDLDTNFVSRFGAASDDHAMVLPLLLRDKVAALVYADSSTETGSPFDAAALELLVTATSAWLEVASLRKQSAKEEVATVKAEASPVQTVSSFSDPFAGHAPSHAAPPPAPEQAAAAAAGVATAEVHASGSGEMSAEDADTHRKAQRFARLLVDEIKLYNQVKVSEGRKNKDLYDRLKEDIEKSRSTYQKRYGNTAASSADYFNQEVVRSLAEDDSSLMGANFRK